MSIRAIILAELNSNPGKRYCHVCLRIVSGAKCRQQVSEATRYLAWFPRIHREPGRCDLCGKKWIVCWATT